MAGQSFGYSSTAPRLNLLRIEEDLSQAHLRLAGVTIENSSWQELVRRYDRAETAFYFDPPYWQTSGYGNQFGFEQYEQLAQAMATMSGKAVLSINDHKDIRPLFAQFRVKRLRLDYTISGAHKRKPAGELIYCNW